MIITTIPQDKPQSEIGQAVAQEVVIKTIPEQPLDDFCLCDLGVFECDYKELAFYGGSNNFENDYTSLYVNKVDASDDIKFILINSRTFEETELNDANTSQYGEYYEDDTFKGIIINFDTLKNAFTDYTQVEFRIEQTVFGTTVSRTTHIYALTRYSDLLADGTVRLESIQSGRIESGNDYNALNWRRAVRFRGFFGRAEAELVTDNYQDGDRVVRQIQDRIDTTYNLETELLPSNIYNVMIYNDLLANELTISDYNLTNPVNYKGFAVTPSSLSSNYYEKNKNGSFEMEFNKRKQNDVKRNV
jgi:hypothetical protein